MSKTIKGMEMSALEKTFKEVRDFVVLSPSGIAAQPDNQMRLALRKKNIRLQIVKNSLTRRVFEKLGLKAAQKADFWTGPTLLAWGGSSLAELTRELESLVKKNEKTLKKKGAISDGQEVTWEQAITMPTKAEAIGRVIGLILSPGSRLVGQILGPAARVAGQIKSLKDKPENKPLETPAPAPA
jgi:large subunit ribosomal protein L10